jgi:hypothetical protein
MTAATGPKISSWQIRIALWVAAGSSRATAR